MGHFEMASFLLDSVSQPMNEQGKLADAANKLWSEGSFPLIDFAKELGATALPDYKIPEPPYHDFQPFTDLLCMVLCKQGDALLAGRLCLNGLNRGGRELSKVDLWVMDALAPLWSNDKPMEDHLRDVLTGAEHSRSLQTTKWLALFDRTRKELSDAEPREAI
jgi:hypothetical protein